MTSVSKRALTKEDEDVSLPSVSSAFKRTKYMREIYVNKVKNENKKLKFKINRDNKYTKNLRKIEDGEDVYIRDLDRMATVINTTPESTRSYNLITEKQDVRRNRCQPIPTNGSTYTTRSVRHVKPPDRIIEA